MTPRTIAKLVIAVVALIVFVYEGCRQLFRARHVDRLEREGKIPSDIAASIRKKPMRLIGWGLVIVGIVFFAKFWFDI